MTDWWTKKSMCKCCMWHTHPFLAGWTQTCYLHISSQVMRARYHSMASPANTGTKHDWVKTRHPTLQAQILEQEEVACHLLFCLITAPPEGHLIQKCFCPKFSRKSAASTQPPPCKMSSSPHKTRAVAQHLERQKNQSLAPRTIKCQPCIMRLLALSSLERWTGWEEVFLCPRPCQSGEFRDENNP